MVAVVPLILAAAVTVVVPTPVLVAKPDPLITATAGADEVHVTCLLRSWVVESLKVPVALYCCEVPRAMVAAAGVIAIVLTVAFVTVNCAIANWPLSDAPIVAVPGAIPVAQPAEPSASLMVAIDEFVEIHVTEDETS